MDLFSFGTYSLATIRVFMRSCWQCASNVSMVSRGNSLFAVTSYPDHNGHEEVWELRYFYPAPFPDNTSRLQIFDAYICRQPCLILNLQQQTLRSSFFPTRAFPGPSTIAKTRSIDLSIS